MCGQYSVVNLYGVINQHAFSKKKQKKTKCLTFYFSLSRARARTRTALCHAMRVVKKSDSRIPISRVILFGVVQRCVPYGLYANTHNYMVPPTFVGHRKTAGVETRWIFPYRGPSVRQSATL